MSNLSYLFFGFVICHGVGWHQKSWVLLVPASTRMVIKKTRFQLMTQRICITTFSTSSSNTWQAGGSTIAHKVHLNRMMNKVHMFSFFGLGRLQRCSHRDTTGIAKDEHTHLGHTLHVSRHRPSAWRCSRHYRAHHRGSLLYHRAGAVRAEVPVHAVAHRATKARVSNVLNHSPYIHLQYGAHIHTHIYIS